jgi:hypothetical protein
MNANAARRSPPATAGPAVPMLVRLGQYSRKRGWVSMWRSLRDHPRYTDSEFVHLLMHLHLCATHEAFPALFDGEEIMLLRGQLITGRKCLGEATGISMSKIERLLHILEIEHEIEQRKCNAGRLITLLSWDYTQAIGQRTGQQPDSQRTAPEHRVDTNNKGNHAATDENGLQRRGESSLKRLKDWQLNKDLDDVRKRISSERENHPPDEELLAGWRAQRDRIKDELRARGKEQLTKSKFLQNRPVEDETIGRPFGRNAGTHNAAVDVAALQSKVR